MSERSNSQAGAGGRGAAAASTETRATTISVDVVLITPSAGQLMVLLAATPGGSGRERWMLPWDAPAEGETLEACATRIARSVDAAPPALLDQVQSFGDARRHPGSATISIGYVGLVPLGAAGASSATDSLAWFPASELPPLTPRQRAIAEHAVTAVRARVNHSPVAFRLLPATFTLTELQSVYELLLGRRLHKASFRRALHAAQLVEATEQWRSEGPGRPAQLFSYAPRPRRGPRRGVRFDLLAG